MATLTDGLAQALYNRVGGWQHRIFKVTTSGGSTADKVVSGFSKVYFAFIQPEASQDFIRVANNSSDGTEGSEAGSVYIVDAGAGGAARLEVFGR